MHLSGEVVVRKKSHDAMMRPVDYTIDVADRCRVARIRGYNYTAYVTMPNHAIDNHGTLREVEGLLISRDGTSELIFGKEVR